MAGATDITSRCHVVGDGGRGTLFYLFSHSRLWQLVIPSLVCRRKKGVIRGGRLSTKRGHAMKTYAGQTGVEGGVCRSNAVVPSSEAGATPEGREPPSRGRHGGAGGSTKKEKRKTSPMNRTKILTEEMVLSSSS